MLTRKRKQSERKKKEKVLCLMLHDAVTLLTTLPGYCDRRFQMSCKAFFSGKSS